MNDSSSKWLKQFQVAAVSDIGMRRNNNQDAYTVLLSEDESAWRKRGHVFVVADGMGAHAAGEFASRLAVDGVVHHYHKLRQLSPPEAILRALRDTNAEIHQRGQANSEFHNMGTTCSVLLILPQGALVAHVGDSRVYRMRRNRIEQLTFDHSLLWEMRAAGSAAATEGKSGIPKNVITRSLGPQASVQVDLEGPAEIQQGDTFMLCSDGLTGKVEDAEIGEILALLPPDEAAALLVDLANLRGGPDNITAIVVRVAGQEVQTRSWRGEPLMVGQDLRPPRRVHAAYWIAILVGVILSAGLAALQLFTFATIGAAVSAVIGVAAWISIQERPGGVPLTAGRRLGRAPYAHAECDTTTASIQRLSDTVRHHLLSDSDETWRDRGRATACLDDAVAKARSGDNEEAMRMLGISAHLVAQRLAESGSPSG